MPGPTQVESYGHQDPSSGKMVAGRFADDGCEGNVAETGLHVAAAAVVVVAAVGAVAVAALALARSSTLAAR
jgi:hypothetical protein